MSSFRRTVSSRRAVYLNLSGSIESQLRQAYAEINAEKGETQTSLGKKLGIGRSVVNRRLTGRTNMTVESIADLVWAMGQCIKVDIFDPNKSSSNEHRVWPHDDVDAGGKEETGPLGTNIPDVAELEPYGDAILVNG